MSDSVTNIEIEDVLSSIRRLVSEETGLQPRPDPVRQPAQEARLVLTPALRVSDDVVKVSVSAETETNLRAGEDVPWHTPDSTLYMAAKIEPEPEAGSEPEFIAVEDEVLMSEAAYDVDDTAETDDLVAPSDVYVMRGVVSGADVGPTLVGPTLVDPIPEVELEWIEEGPSIQQDAGNEGRDDLQVSGDQWLHEVAPLNDLPVDDLTPLSAKIEALETAIGETQDQWEPDGMAGDDYAGTPVKMLRWQDHQPEPPVSAEDDTDTLVVQETGAETITPEMPSAAETDLDADDDDVSELDFRVGDDSLMDEESLRELIADIVREELQGALGERITRNVRKLVRREIQRALTTQQLD